MMRKFSAAAFVAVAAAYETWHVVDVPSVVCPAAGGGGSGAGSNLAAGKTYTCDVGVYNCNDGGLTDGVKTCMAAMSSPRASKVACDSRASVTIDLGSAQAFDEVILHQYTCSAMSYCGHMVETSTDGTTFAAVYTAPSSGYNALATSEGSSFRFSETTARYVRVSSSRSDTSMSVYFIEVEVFKGRPPPPPPPFAIEIYKTSQLDASSPYILSFIRSSKQAMQIAYELKDANGQLVDKDSVMLSATGLPPPSTCKCTGARLSSQRDISIYSAEYGSECAMWDILTCDVWWPNQTLGDWCCDAWCYADPSCPDAYMSSLIPGGYFSYSACATYGAPGGECQWKPKDPCECRNVENIMDQRMKELFPPSYGATCGAWDSTSCEFNYRPDQIDTWCCKSWCYVGEECPLAKPSLNPGMEGKLFWADQQCAQDAGFISQCPYKKMAEDTELNYEKCECLGEDVPTSILKTGQNSSYGKTCGAYDKDFCDTWYPGAQHDMWCCSSWCYVSPQCPDAQPSTIWPGHYYSGYTCDWDPVAARDCKYSNACRCSGKNTGIDTAKYGATYGTSCGAWDGPNCKTWWGNTAFWSNTSRNDWCCQPWCYVNQTCPLVDQDSELSTLQFSYDVCTKSAEVFSESAGSCVAAGSCACLGSSASAAWKPTASYGEACAVHDVPETAYGRGRGIDACLPWCYVSDACPSAFPHPNFTGAFISYDQCASVVNNDTLKNCPYSNSCKCQNNNTGIDGRFPSDYGLQCKAHDAAKCYEWWGPQSGSGFWNTDVGGNNNWCCDSWCYVAPDCPFADGIGEGGLFFAYKACPDGTNEVFNTATNTCPNVRRLQEPVVVEEDLEEGDGCEEFFLMDGRSPAELPETFADAQEATTAICLDEGYEYADCVQAAAVAFEGFPAGDVRLARHAGAEKMCIRLLVLGAVVEASDGAFAEMQREMVGQQQQQEDSEQPGVDDQPTLSGLAERAREALRERAGQSAAAAAVTSPMDQTLAEKTEAWKLRTDMRAVADTERRLKGAAPTPTPSPRRRSPSPPPPPPPPPVRRRTPQRPSGVASRRRGSVAGQRDESADYDNDDPFEARRRRTTSFSQHRRRVKDINGQSRKTASGIGYGYTSKTHLASQFGGRVPAQTSYGYSAGDVYKKDSRKSMAMYGAAAAGGAVAGAGAYHLYQHRYHPGSDLPSWRRRRAGPPMYCMGPASSQVDMIECGDCFEAFGSCESASDCYTAGGSGCGIATRRNYGKDDLINSGFIPGKYKFPLRLTFSSITGNDVGTDQVCPPTDPNSAAANFQKVSGFNLDLFVTLSRMEALDDTAPPQPKCIRNTNYPCKPGASVGAIGLGPCYGEDEVCESEGSEKLCFCKQGYCLDTSKTNGLCLPDPSANGANGSMGGYKQGTLLSTVLMVATLLAARMR